MVIHSPIGCKSYLFLVLELLQEPLELLLFLYGLSLSCLVLFIISHGYHSQDEVDEVERAQKYNHHKKQHVCLSSGPQDLCLDQKRNYEN